jgi:predicted dehydrogenase
MIEWLVVGIGDISTKRFLPGILAEPRSRLAGIVTRHPAKAAPYHVRSWTSLEAALAECAAEAVYIATPVFLHASQTVAALRAGRHVLCEKPMAVSYDQALEMQRVCEETGRTLGVAYYRRMYPKIERARELIAAGAIGRPVFAEASSHDWFYPADGFRSWLIDPVKAGGGPLYDIACHRIDLMNYFLGRPVRVTAHLSTLIQPIPVEDNASVLIEYDSGARALVDARWHSRVVRDEFRIRGTDGELDLSPLNGPELVFPGRTEDLPAPSNRHYPCIQDFVNAILSGQAPRSSGATALVTDWVLGEAKGAAIRP